MPRYMLDTNICIYIIKNRPPQVKERLQGLSRSELLLSAITLAELECGVGKSQSPRARPALDAFAAALTVAAFDAQAAKVYGALRASLERAGTPMGALDTLIAAHALRLGSVLVTNNRREFQRAPGLVVENWV